MKTNNWLLASTFLLGLAACNDDNDSGGTPAPSADFPTEVLTPTNTTLRVSDLPAPFASMSVTNFPQVLAMRPASAKLRVPQGYAVNMLKEEIPGARWLAVAPNGDIFVAQSMMNQITVLRDANKDGQAEEMFVWATGGMLNRPHGMVFDGDFFYVGNTSSIVRYNYTSGQTQASGEPTKLADLPALGNHFTRTLLIHNGKLYAAIGSENNVGLEDDPRRATIQEYNLDGTGGTTYSAGLRNPVGLAVNPVSKEIWTTVNERDELGDDLVPDYLTAVPRGSFFGYPYVYLAPGNRDPRISGPLPAEVATTRTPEVLFRSHSAALGLAFYTGTAFPADARNDAFVAMRGSWNRSVGTGYKVVRVKINDQGQPEGGYEDFVTGWHLNPDQQAAPQVFGRPIAVVTATDGSLLVADDAAGIVWRVSYRGN